MANPTIDDLYKSLQAADAAGDTKAAQVLADYIRSIEIPSIGGQDEMKIEQTTGAPLPVRHGSSALRSKYRAAGRPGPGGCQRS